MNRVIFAKSATVFSAVMAILLVTGLTGNAQTTTTSTAPWTKWRPKKKQSQTTATSTQPAQQTTSTQTSTQLTPQQRAQAERERRAQEHQTSTSSTATSTAPNTTATGTTTGSANSNSPGSMASQFNQSNSANNTPGATGRNGVTQRGSPVSSQGVGTFRSGTSTLTSYGCYRSNNSVLCDFDLTAQNNGQIGLNQYNSVRLVSGGGRITGRSDAYYVDAEGGQMQSAFVAPQQPVRYVMVFQNVPQQANSVSLINGNDQIQNVPVSAMDASQGGKIPTRSNGPQQTQNATPQQNQPAPAAPAGQTGNAVNGGQTTASSTSTANQGNQGVKKRARGLWNSLSTSTHND